MISESNQFFKEFDIEKAIEHKSTCTCMYMDKNKTWQLQKIFWENISTVLKMNAQTVTFNTVVNMATCSSALLNIASNNTPIM